MRKLDRRRLCQLGTSLPLLLAGCSSSSSEGGDDAAAKKHQIELFSWWIAQGEADALQTLIDLHASRFPNQRVYNAAVESSEDSKKILAERLAANQPPDMYQENAFNLGSFLEANPGGLVPLTDFFSEEGLLEVVVPEVVENVTFEGEIVAMPVNIHRENALHYNQRVFDDAGVEVPTTLDEFWKACEALKAAGVTPLAMSHQGWIVRILFNSLLSASMGPREYERFFTGAAELDEAAMRTGIELLDKALTHYVNDSASGPDFGWTQAADLLLEGEAAMFIHGDWAKGYLQGKGMAPGAGFGQVGMPGAANFFLYGVDVFAILAGGAEPEASKDFLRTVSSREGQTAFNRIKGSSPIRLDVGASNLDVIARKTFDELSKAEVRMLTRRRAEWDVAFSAFAVNRDPDPLLKAYIDYPPVK